MHNRKRDHAPPSLEAREAALKKAAAYRGLARLASRQAAASAPVANAITIVMLIMGSIGTVVLIAIAIIRGEGLRREADAAPEVCLHCTGHQWTADCTCPRRCTAMTCLALPGGAREAADEFGRPDAWPGGDDA